MATQNEGLENTSAQCDPISAAKFNLWAGVIERISSVLGEAATDGFLNATDFNGSVVAGQKKISLSGGWAFLGSSGHRIPVYAAGAVQYDLVGSGGGTTNYVYVIHGGTAVVVQNTMDAPADSLLALTCSCDSTEASAINDFPSGRTNLRDFLAVKATANDRQGKHLYDALAAGSGVSLAVLNSGANEQVQISAAASSLAHSETFTLACVVPVGSQGIATVDFALIGSYSEDYFVRADADTDKVAVELLASGRNSHSFKLFIDVPSDADAGSYGTAYDIQLTIQVQGRGFTAGVGGSATISEAAFTPPAPSDVPLGAWTRDPANTDTTYSIEMNADWLGGNTAAGQMHRAGVLTGYSARNHGATRDIQLQVQLNLVDVADTGVITPTAYEKSSSLAVPFAAGDFFSLWAKTATSGTGPCSIILYGYYT